MDLINNKFEVVVTIEDICEMVNKWLKENEKYKTFEEIGPTDITYYDIKLAGGSEELESIRFVFHKKKK